MDGILFATLIVAGIGLVAAVLLSIAAKYMSVPVDEKFPAIRAELPGANCGACGYAGCDGYAKALASGAEENPGKCVPGSKAVAEALSKLLGKEAVAQEVKVAYVRCNGNCDATGKKVERIGDASCKAAGLSFGGDGKCRFGCLGCGDCAAVCPEHAITVESGVAVVNRRQCIGCGMCVRTCPRHLIELVSPMQPVIVTCMNKEKGASARKNCTNACIGCGLCARKCEQGAITVTDNLAHIDPEKCVGCGACKEACPQKCIH